MSRTSYEESCKLLEPYGVVSNGEIPILPERRPKYDDEVLGVSFFRMRIEGGTFNNLTLPRSFFGKSEIKDTSFAGTDLTESNLCWNDFVKVSFQNALLIRADLRAAIFNDCDFTGCDFTGADLRHSSFKNCVFDGSLLKRTTMPRKLKKTCKLSPLQASQVRWVFFEGSAPLGG